MHGTVKEVKVSMYVCMHVCVCAPLHNPIQMNEEYVFLFIQLVKG